MAYKEYRKLTVSEQSGYRYKHTPSIRLQGAWLTELGFNIDEKVDVLSAEAVMLSQILKKKDIVLGKVSLEPHYLVLLEP